MKKYLLTLSLLTLGIIGLVFVTAPTAGAHSFQCGSADIETSIDFGDYAKRYCGSADSSPVTALILMVVEFLAVGVGIAVVGGIAAGGVMYALAGGEPAKVKQAISIITNAVIALVLFIFMYAIINFFVPGGVFS